MVLSILNTLLQTFWAILKLPLMLLGVALAVWGLLCAVQYIKLYRQGYRMKPGQRRPVKKRSAFLRLFWDFPKRVILDAFERDPDFFTYQGLHLFCGEQGAGKTIAVVEMIMRIQQEFPKAKCITNLGYQHEDAELDHWTKLLTYTNGPYGVIVGLDELQNWFASGANTLPPQMLEVATQNRKNRRIMLGTSQVFTRLAKGLREQCTLVYEPLTILNCLTWVRVFKYQLDAEGNIKDKKRRGSYFFVHTKELREAYDTYKVIHSLAKSDFKQQPMEVVQRTVVNIQQGRK